MMTLREGEQAVVKQAKILLEERGVVICIEALYLAGQWHHRQDIRWPIVREALQAQCRRGVMGIHLADLRHFIPQIHPETTRPLEVPDEIAELLRQGSGNAVAAFMWWPTPN